MAENTIKSLENLISLTSLRQKVIAKNIANINTEYYKREEVTFDEFLQSVMTATMKKTNEKHFGSSLSPELKDMNLSVIEDPKSDFNSGINNVNIDREMSDLAENQILFKFASQKIGNYFKSIQSVIKGTSI